jgi:outer membrane protein
MKNASIILSSLSFIGVLILFVLHFNSKTVATSGSRAVSSNAAAGPYRIAYVDVDTFEAHYTSLKEKRDQFQKRQSQMEAELQRSAAQYQNNLQEAQKKAQSGSMTQSEGEATQKKLLQMQQSLQLREQALNDQLVKEKETFNKELQNQMDAFLNEYNKEKNYDYILSYSKSLSLILFANKDLDITQDVIKGMNDRAQKMVDTSNKK